MLKHILTGQPSSTGSRHHHNDYQTSSGSGVTGHRGNNSGIDVYDSVARPTATTVSNAHQSATTPSSTHRHPLNHSQLSVNNLSQRLNHSHALNVSTLSTSKHSVNSVSPVGGVHGNNGGGNNNNNHNVSASQLGHTVISQTNVSHQERPKANGGFDISRLSRLPSQTTPSPAPATSALPVVASQVAGGPTVIPLNASWSSSLSRNLHRSDAAGVKEMLTSLGLLCLVSLLLALLSVIFLLKISPLTVTSNSLISPEEFVIVYEVTLALCALALSLNLCCLLVCAIQFLFAVKLVKTSYQGHRLLKERILAVNGFIARSMNLMTNERHEKDRYEANAPALTHCKKLTYAALINDRSELALVFEFGFRHSQRKCFGWETYTEKSDHGC
ncbi:hypothetical protein G5I_10670 [Acromyrmex echinatior]|uniref:Uncharacterized protein n=1 Tax=Acromyrmex echinatior TaxID=103372 RepID=F4WXI5_ACREC|nr:hypothetical protein G5I_10670 [Acromyrmex echinatior]